LKEGKKEGRKEGRMSKEDRDEGTKVGDGGKRRGRR
jgi:hypothetical protein